MEPIKQAALDKGVAFLNAAGVEYAIRKPDGSTIGTLLIAEPKKRKSRTLVHNWNAKFGYVHAIINMQVGDTLSWSYPDDGASDWKEALQSFYSSVRSVARNRLGGKDNCVIQLQGDTVTLMRVI